MLRTSYVLYSLERGEKILNFDTSWRSLAILNQKLQHLLYCVVEAQGLILKLEISSFQKCYWNTNPNYSHVRIILYLKLQLCLLPLFLEHLIQNIKVLTSNIEFSTSKQVLGQYIF